MRLFLNKSALKISLLTCLAATLGTTAEAASLSVVAQGLDNPRGLSFSPDGSLYVTESGIGGDGRCVPGPSLEGLPTCVGTSGAVTKISDGKQERVLTGLPSIALQPGGDVGTGPQDIEFDAQGNPYLLIGLGGNPEVRDFPLDAPSWGQLYEVDFDTGSLSSIADFASYELANNPDGGTAIDIVGEIASNVYAFTIEGDTAYVVDAAANDLLSVGLDRSNLTAVTALPKQTVSDPVFPPSAPGQELPPEAPSEEIPSELEIESVPTGVAVGSDGALYISEYTGFPFPEGEARIFRVDASGEPTVYAEGFTQLIDLDFDAAGNLYALQYANEPEWKRNLEGSLIQIAPDGTRSTMISGMGLEAPTALTIGPDGAVYVSNRGDRAGVGQVVRIEGEAVEAAQSVPEPGFALGVVAFGVGCGWLRKHQRR